MTASKHSHTKVRETWSLTLKEECRLRVFANRILRRIFGPNSDEKGEWRRFNNEGLHSHADDVALIADTEDDLQRLLYNFHLRYLMGVNITSSGNLEK